MATGEVWGRSHARHTHKEFLAFFKQIEDRTPAGLDIPAVLDNYATHSTDAVARWLALHPRWQAHFIPAHSSWLNQVERFLAELTRKRLQRELHQCRATALRHPRLPQAPQRQPAPR